VDSGSRKENASNKEMEPFPFRFNRNGKDSRELRMDMSLVSGILAAQSGGMQMQVAATILKSNMDAEKSAVMTLLGAGQQNASSLANVAAGIGGNLDVSV
jgi:hypothetical protein